MGRKIILILIALLVVGGIAAAVFSGNKDTGTRVFASEAQARDLQEVVSASGKVFSQTEVKISSDVSGEVVELYVEEGDSVVPNQLLAKIDADAFQSQVARGVAGVNSSRANLANARAQVQTLEAQRMQTESQVRNAREIFERNEQLYRDEVISEAELQAARNTLAAQEAALRAAESNVEAARESANAAQYNVRSSEATLNETRTSLRRTTIYAPMGGVVSLLNIEQGERVVGTIQMAGTELMRIANLNKMEVRVEVSENDVPRVSIGDRAEVEVDAYLKRTFTGRVTQIASSSTSAAVAENVLNSDQVTNFEVRISIDPESYADLINAQNPYPFRPGMSAAVDILTERAEGAISVPIEAVTTRERPEAERSRQLDDLLEVVFRITGDTLEQVEVATGLLDDSYIQVTRGLSAGDRVVAGPYEKLSRELKSGQRVTVVDKDDYYQQE